jgi:DNA modification methylase|tara:strand:- start:1346 stop:1543 length:198 start_codon:yes stop_codon:yes gene_type:complete
MIIREIIEVKDELYSVQRKVKISNEPNVERWKEHLQSDKVFKKEPFYYFCLEINEAEEIEDEDNA